MIYQMPKVPAMKRGWFRDVDRIRVDEKIDGSQISFGVAPEGVVRTAQGKQAPENDFLTKPTLWIRSKSRFLSLDNPDKMFAPGVEAIKAREACLNQGITFIGEYLQKPKHNVLAYERIPENHVVLFDVVDEVGFYSLGALRSAGKAAGFEVVQSEEIPFNGTMPDSDYFKTSMLGGILEGVVVKQATVSLERVFAKIVSPQFKEVKGDRVQRNQQNPDKDIALKFANRFCPPARFVKAVQRLKENGEWQEAMRDLPKLRELVSRDLDGECGEQMKEELWGMFRKDILRAALQPLAAWYEQYLTNDNAFWSMVREQQDAAEQQLDQ